MREVGDGNLNLVFIVEGPAGGLVVKQALPYVRLVGESWPLPLERSWFEYNALVEEGRYAPRLTPQVFHFDREQAMIVMEYLSPHIIMRKGLVRGIEYPRFAADIAEFLAATLFHTSVLAGTAAEHKRRLELFARNIELCRITEDLVFTDPYREAPLNRWTSPQLDADKRAFETDAPLKAAAQVRKYQFLTDAQALIHGDLHTGSIMLTTADTRVIDPEFAFVGPIGFDVGAVIGNLLLAYFAQEGHEAAPHARDPYRAWILDQVVAVWTGFHDRFLALWRQAKGGEAFVAGLFTSPQDEAALDAERRRFLRSLFEDALAFRWAQDDPPHSRPRPRRGPGKHRRSGTARDLRAQGIETCPHACGRGSEVCRRLRRDRSGARGRARLSRTRPDYGVVAPCVPV